jgi:hypothetical protein
MAALISLRDCRSARRENGDIIFVDEKTIWLASPTPAAAHLVPLVFHTQRYSNRDATCGAEQQKRVDKRLAASLRLFLPLCPVVSRCVDQLHHRVERRVGI